MSLAGIAANYGRIVEGEQAYAQQELDSARRQQQNYESAIKLRLMREQDARNKELSRNQRVGGLRPTVGDVPGFELRPAPPPSNPAPYQESSMRHARPVAAETEMPGDVTKAAPMTVNEVAARIASRAGGIPQYAPGVTPAYLESARALPANRRAAQRAQAGGYTELPGLGSTSTGTSLESLRLLDAARKNAARPPAQPQTGGATGSWGPPVAAGASAPATGVARGHDSKITTYDPLFTQAEQKYGLPAGVLRRLAISESSLNPTAHNVKDSHGGSFGIMQINGQHFGRGIDRAGALNPATSIDFAARMLADSLHQTGGDMAAALQLYKGVKSDEKKRAYATTIAQVMGTAPGGQAGAASPAQAQPAPAPPPALGPAVAFSPQTFGLAKARTERLHSDRAQLERMFNAAAGDPAMREQFIARINDIDDRLEESALVMLTSAAASGHAPAMGGLAQAMSNDMGAPVTVQRAGEEQVVITVGGRASQPMSYQEAADLMYGKLSAKMQASRAALHAIGAEAEYKARGESAGKLPAQMTLDRAKAADTARLELQKHVQEVTKLIEQGLVDAGKVKMYMSPEQGVFTVTEGGRVQRYVPPGGVDKNGYPVISGMVDVPGLPAGTKPVSK